MTSDILKFFLVSVPTFYFLINIGYAIMGGKPSWGICFVLSAVCGLICAIL